LDSAVPNAVPLVIMGVAGSGKTTVAAHVARAAGRALLEGDDFHPAENLRKMRAGIPLVDEDRREWLDGIADAIRTRGPEVVVSCSALKRAYRDRLRAAAPGLRFVFLDVTPDVAHRRVAERAASHFFSPALVDSQFAALESPVGEAGVLRLDATLPAGELTARAVAWIAPGASL
jgi:gluconokinase